MQIFVVLASQEVKMSLIQRSRQVLLSLALVLVLMVTTACGGTATSDRTSALPSASGAAYSQIERGDTRAGQDFGQWVVQTARGLVSDAYVRDDSKLGVVITPEVRPNEVRPFSRSLVEGFRKNFPNRDLTVLVYAPDKQLILTAQYDNRSQQIQYE
jgi:hypothetical protein